MKDEQTEALKRFNDEQAKIVAEYVQKSVIEELEKIKTEIREMRSKQNCSCSDCLDILDKHISELKGVNK